MKPGIIALETAAIVLSLAAIVPGVAVGQQTADMESFEQGRQLYQDRCVICHQESGLGVPPAFPALSGNEQLSELDRIVGNISQGMDSMPPFPELSAEEIASVATYIRNDWANDFGAVTAADAARVLDGLGGSAQMASVWDGVFTDAQAQRGRAIYPSSCGYCHGRRLNGAPDDPDMRPSPPLARARFLRIWEGRSLATLFEYTKATMPESNPESLTDEEYVDVIAYMLSVGGLPAGTVELQADPGHLSRTIITQSVPQ